MDVHLLRRSNHTEYEIQCAKKHNNLLGHWFRATFDRHVEHRNLAEGDLVLGSALEFR